MQNVILIIEDSAEDLQILQRALAQEPCRLVHARDERTGMALIEQENPDMVILDVVLPETDGFEICRNIRKDERLQTLPVLFFTSSHSLDNKLIGLQLGASDFLFKDCDERELCLKIRNILRAKKLYDEMVKLSVIDALTHLYNRRYFQHRLLDEFERGKRYSRDFCCIIIDVDHFKEVNDTQGHLAGDAVLRNVSAILRRSIRGADVLCRYGGDEFAVLLPETNFTGAEITAERMRQVIEKSDVGKPQTSAFVTLSCGISSLSDGGALGMDELLTQADVALYQAKRAGRNKVCCYGKSYKTPASGAAEQKGGGGEK